MENTIEKNSLEENIKLFESNHFQAQDSVAVVKLVMQIHGNSDEEQYE